LATILIKDMATVKKPAAKKTESQQLTGTDCFNHLVKLDGKKVTIGKTGEVITAKSEAEALQIFQAAIANSQFQ